MEPIRKCYNSRAPEMNDVNNFEGYELGFYANLYRINNDVKITVNYVN